MRQQRPVVTGLGVVTPAGRGKEAFFQAVLGGKAFIREVDRFDASRYPSRHAGMLAELDDGAFPKRLVKKLDRFSHMALVAAGDALDDSGLRLAVEDRDRVGIILGNALGGWAFAEEELRDLYRYGLREVSPYQATAWFPAAPQGQISIHYGITGFSKTIISDIASSHLALDYAARSVAAGRADVVLAGGTEAPISPYALLCCNTSGELSRSGAYMPFDRQRDGYVIGEGAAILVVEGHERARARGARVYAELTGFGHTSDGVSPTRSDGTGEGVARAMRMALEAAGVAPSDVDYIMPSGNAGVLTDLGEASALGAVFGEDIGRIPVGIPKTLFGNLLGASGAADAAAACLAVERGAAPITAGCGYPEKICPWAKRYGDAVFKRIDNVIVNSIGRGGVNASLVLGRPRG